MKTKSEKPAAGARADFSTKAYPRHLTTFALLVLVIATALFWILAARVAAGNPPTPIDARLSGWLHTHASEPLTTFLFVVTTAHSHWAIAIITLSLGAWWWKRGLRGWALILTMAVFGSMLLNLLLKHLFLRPRPEWGNPLLVLTTYSFPSGHTMLATVFYGTLCAFVYSRVRDWRGRLLAVVGAALMILLVGFSRLYLGVHYPSDIIGAITEGLAWLAFLFLAANLARLRRGKRS